MEKGELLRYKALKRATKYLQHYGPLHRDQVVLWAQKFEYYLRTGENINLIDENSNNKQ
jgi:hypothetical protein